MNFDEVMEAMRGEREYQLRRWGIRGIDDTMTEAQHSVGEWMVYIQDYLTDAMHRSSRESGDQGALDSLRKVATMCIACFEQNGVVLRDKNAPVINGRDGQSA